MNLGSTHPHSVQPQVLHGLAATPHVQPKASLADGRILHVGDGAERETLLDAHDPIPHVQVLTTLERMRVAVEGNDVASLRELFALDPDGVRESINDRDEAFLVRASELGHVALLRCLLDCEANPDIQDAEGRTAFLVAAGCEHDGIGMMELLLECGADPDIQDGEGRTALHVAVRRQDLARVHWLLDVDVSFELRDVNNWSVLMHAVSAHSEQRMPIVELLLSQWDRYEWGINAALPLNPNDDTYTTALLDVIDAGADLEMLELLLQRGANVDQEGSVKDGTRLPLIATISMRRADLFKRLLDAGAEFRLRDSKRDNALTRVVSDRFAQRGSMLECVLRSHSRIDPVCVSVTDWYGQIEAASKPYQEMLNSLLAEMRGQLNAQDDLGRNALMDVIRGRGDLALVKSLLEQGGGIGLRDDDGWNLLMVAVAHKRLDVVKLLLPDHIDINARDASGRTALMDVIEADGDLAVIESLLERGADVRLRDGRGWNALMYATSMKSEAVELILNKISDLNARDAIGLTALDDMINAAGNLDWVRHILAANSSFGVQSRGQEDLLVKLSSTDSLQRPRSVAAHAPEALDLMNLLESKAVQHDACYIQEKLCRAIEGGEAMPFLRQMREHFKEHVQALMEIKGDSYLKDFIERGHAEMVHFLLESGVSPNAADELGRTPLYAAILTREPKIVLHLLAAGANIRLRARDGRNPLMLAVAERRRDRLKTIERILPTGVDLSSQAGWQTLSNAVWEPRQDTLALLLSYITDVDSRDAEGRTVLFDLIDAGADLSTVENFLVRDPNLQMRDRHGRNAFMHAASATDAPEEILLALTRHLERQPELKLDRQEMVADMTDIVKARVAMLGQVKRRLQEIESDRDDLEQARAQRTRAVNGDELVALDPLIDPQAERDATRH